MDVLPGDGTDFRAEFEFKTPRPSNHAQNDKTSIGGITIGFDILSTFIFLYYHISIYLFSFPVTYLEGLLFSWPLPCLSSLLDFLFLDPAGKTAVIV